MVRRAWASVAALVILALGLTVGAAAAAAAPVAAGRHSVAQSGSGPVQGGFRRLDRVHSTTPTPARPAPTGAKEPTSPPPRIPKASKPNASHQQYIATYGPITIEAGYHYAAWLPCPSGMLATGGGESNTSGAGVTLHHTFAMANGAGWQVFVTNDYTTDSTFTVYAVCMSGLTNYSEVTAGVTQNGGAWAYCPAGTVVLGGGGWSTNPDDILTFEPIYNGWSAYRLQDVPTTPGTVTGQAICASGIGNYSIQSAGIDLNPGEYASVAVNCPAGTVVFGGVATSGEVVRSTDSYPLPSTQGWKAWGILIPTTYEAWPMYVYAICGT